MKKIEEGTAIYDALNRKLVRECVRRQYNMLFTIAKDSPNVAKRIISYMRGMVAAFMHADFISIDEFKTYNRFFERCEDGLE